MSFNINAPTSANLLNLSNNVATTRIPLSYTLDTSSRWIYCNYPEILTTDDFGDADDSNRGKCLNQVTVPAGTHTLFFSYLYNTGSHTEGVPNPAIPEFYFGIQVYNPTRDTMKFQVLRSGYGTNAKMSCGSWDEVPGRTYNAFFYDQVEDEQTIPMEGNYWFLKYKVQKDSSLISGNFEFSVSTSAVITVYIYKNLYNIKGYATPVEMVKGAMTYSGYAIGSHYVSQPIRLIASEMGTGRFFQTERLNFPSDYLFVNGVRKTSDLLPIYLANPSGEVIEPSSATNLGNWGLIYEYPLSLYNNTNSPVTFNGYIKTDVNGFVDYPIINVAPRITSYTDLYNNVSGKYNAWHWLSQTVGPGSIVSGTYSYVLGTNSYAGNRHIFTIS